MRPIIILLFITGAILCAIAIARAPNAPSSQYPDTNILQTRQRDYLLKNVFFDPTPWQQVNTYTAYKGDYFNIIGDRY